MTFGEKIKNLRIACKKTQAELADETGVAKRSIQLYEAGKKQAEDLANQIVGLFAGGQVLEEDADKVMLVLQKAYWDIKEKKAKENGLL